MKIGFITDNYHTEVLEFLFELFFDQEQLILYNDCDNYLNWDLYTKKFNNISRKNICDFFPDLGDKLCDKIFIVTYDNLCLLKLLCSYRDRCIVICHTVKNINDCIDLNFKHITLSPMLLKQKYENNCMWMLPLTKNNEKLVDNENKPIQNFEKIKLMTIGAFDNNNKNIDKITELLQHDDIELHVFLMTVSDTIKQLMKKYKNIILHEKISTTSILEYINAFNVKYLLYTPNENSEFMKGKWSGSIAFAYNNDLQLILPETIATNNNLQDCITYNEGDNIYNIISNLNNSDASILTSHKFKTLNWERNNLMKNILLQVKNYKYVYTNFDVVFLSEHMEKEDISKKEYISLNVISELVKDKDNICLINVDSHLGVENSMFMSVNKNMQIISIEQNYDFCINQKNTNTINFFNDKIKIFNNKIDEKNIKNDEVEMMTLDTIFNDQKNMLSNKKIIIYINDGVRINNILKGCEKSIYKYNPSFVFPRNTDLTKCKLLTNVGYHFKVIDNKIICKK